MSVMKKYTYIIESTCNGKRTLDGVNIEDVCEQLGFKKFSITNNQGRHFKSTPLLERSWTVYVYAAIKGHESSYGVTIKSINS